jgi:CheY-like chemotaxis protein
VLAQLICGDDGLRDVRQERRRVPRAKPSRPSDAPGRIATRVLLVEDDDDTLDIYAHGLTNAGMEVDTAKTGMDAVVKAITEPPDVVIMDLELPVMDGLEATRRLKADPRTAHIPVIAITAYVFTGPSMAAEAGCDRFLPKPCHPDLLVHHVSVLRHRRRS